VEAAQVFIGEGIHEQNVYMPTTKLYSSLKRKETLTHAAMKRNLGIINAK
jgi:hypothetical protein